MSRSWFASTVIAALVSAAVCYGLHYTGALPTRSAEVPAIEGLDTAQARELLVARDLLLVVDGELPSPARSGTLVQQRPLSGSQLARGSTVHAFSAVATAAPSGTAPSAAPLPAPTATAPTVAAPTAAAPTAAAPTVAAPTAAAPPSARPAPTRAPDGKPRAVPALVGKRLPQARELIQRSGFTVGAIRSGNDGDVGPDRVLRQQPAAGTLGDPGAPIDLVVNETE